MKTATFYLKGTQLLTIIPEFKQLLFHDLMDFYSDTTGNVHILALKHSYRVMVGGLVIFDFETEVKCKIRIKTWYLPSAILGKKFDQKYLDKLIKIIKELSISNDVDLRE